MHSLVIFDQRLFGSQVPDRVLAIGARTNTVLPRASVPGWGDRHICRCFPPEGANS